MLDEKERIKLASLNLSPTDSDITRVIECEYGLLEIDKTDTVGVADNKQLLLVQDHPDSMVQSEEHPSPFKALPSSQRSVIMMPSPQ